VSAFQKAKLYLQASCALRDLNIRGFPLLPKRLFNFPVHNRAAYNEFITWIQRLHLRSACWVADVGANHGDFAEAATSCFPESKVLLVEPLSNLHAELQRRCDRHRGKWLLEKCALGAEDAVLPLHIVTGEDTIGSLAGFSRKYQQVNPHGKIEQIPCNVRPLDAVLAQRQIQTVDLLKIDVEGFEFEVLKGATNALDFTRAIIVEVSLVRRTGETVDPLEAMLDLLKRRKFHVVDIIPSVFDISRSGKAVEFNILGRRPDPGDA
jgi:FkbM family methyltransferase